MTSLETTIRVRRDAVESAILDPIHKDLLAPERVARMAAELQELYAEHIRRTSQKAESLPQELQELTARIDRLRERLKKGDPDMTADEIQAAIDRALAKQDELQGAHPEANQSAKILTAVPRAAAPYCQQIALGLDGDPREVLKARLILREMFGGEIMLSPEPDGTLWANFAIHPAVLLRGVGTGGGP